MSPETTATKITLPMTAKAMDFFAIKGFCLQSRVKYHDWCEKENTHDKTFSWALLAKTT